MAKTTDRETLESDERLFEEAFLLQAQIGIQRLLDEKRLKYRDLSKRLGVSEARVSQMFGDEAANLTIRTIARIYYRLDEQPVILTRKEFQRLTADQAGCSPSNESWIVEEMETSTEERSARSSSEWLEAAPMLMRVG